MGPMTPQLQEAAETSPQTRGAASRKPQEIPYYEKKQALNETLGDIPEMNVKTDFFQTLQV